MSTPSISMGVGVFVVRRVSNEPHFLLGRRGPASRRGADLWALPGGMCAADETLADCAHREVREETGLDVRVIGPHKFNAKAWPYCLHDNVPHLAVTDHRPREPHLTFWMLAEWTGGEAVTAEPDKCTGWAWVTPFWVRDCVPGVDADPQRYWTPLDLWRLLLPRVGFDPFS